MRDARRASPVETILARNHKGRSIHVPPTHHISFSSVERTVAAQIMTTIATYSVPSRSSFGHTPLIDGSATRTSASNTTGGQKEPNTESAKGFSEGVYFRLRYSRGVRLRIMSIDGSNTASAVFVDRKALE